MRVLLAACAAVYVGNCDACSKHATCCNKLCRAACCRCCEPACSLLLCNAACCHLRLCCLLQVKGEMEPAAEARDAQAKRKPLQPSSQVKAPVQE